MNDCSNHILIWINWFYIFISYYFKSLQWLCCSCSWLGIL